MGSFNQITSIKDYKKLPPSQLEILASDLRSQLIHEQATNPFLGSNLGVVELSIALHYVFHNARDKVLWDIGHQKQAYNLLSQKLKLCPAEAPLANTKPGCVISRAVGYAISRDIQQDTGDIISIIGDIALSSGQAFEAMNHAGSLASKMIVILNDNTENHQNYGGAFGYYLKQLQNKHYHDIPCLFEDLGFNYAGPIDGHDIEALVTTLTQIKQSKERTPYLLHIKTQKGKGHGPSQADSVNGGVIKANKNANKDFLKSEKDKKSPYFACKALIEAAHLDPKIIVISHSLTNQKSPFLAFRDLFPERYIDSGVSEGHAISLSYVLAAQGYKPYVILYSNMLQRVLDQALIDACLQSYPIRFIIDHSSIVFHNIQHAGFFDTAFLGTLPNLLLMSPSSQESVTDIIQFSAQDLSSPCVIRLSKELWSLDITHPPVEMAKGHYIQHGSRVGILSYGSVLKECVDATRLLEEHGISTTLADARFMQPIDEKMVFQMSKKHDVFVSVEENSSGGLSSQILRVVCKMGLLNDKFHYYPIFLKQIQGINDPPIVTTPEQIFHTIQTLLSFPQGGQNLAVAR